MANPTFEQGSIPRRKQPGEALTGKDAALVTENIGIHNTIPPSLANGDVAFQQMDDLGNVKMALGDPAQVATLESINAFSIPTFDYIALGYTGTNLTSVVYRTGGSGGTIVATLTLAYTGDVLNSITKT